MIIHQKGKKHYTIKEVRDILEEIREELTEDCEDNLLMQDILANYFDNFKL